MTVTAGNQQFPEDTAHVSGDKGTQMLAVRKDTVGPLALLNGNYSPLQTDANGRLRVIEDQTASLTNGLEFAVTSAVAVQLLPANPNRKKLIVEVTNGSGARIGTVGVTGVTGIALGNPGQTNPFVLESPNCPTNDIWAIKTGAGTVTVFATEVI